MLKGLTVYQLTVIITNLFTMYIINRFVKLFLSNPEDNWKRHVWTYGIYFFFLSFGYLYFDIPILTLMINIFGIFLITLNFNVSNKERLITVSFMYFFMFAVELVIASLTGFFHIDIFETGDYRKSVGLVVCKIITFLLVLLMENFKKVKWKEKISTPLFLSTLLVPTSTIIIAIIFVTNTSCSKMNIITIIALLLGLNAFTFYMYDKLSEKYNEQIKMKIAATERNYFYNQCKVMQKSAEDLRSFRHDINNHISSISELLTQEKYNEAVEYMNQLSSKNAQVSSNYSQTGNIVIDSIINYKLATIDRDRIKVSTEIIVPNRTNIEIMDLSTILNNLLDNSINALSKDIEEKILTVLIKYSRKRMIIRITNSFDGKLHYKNGVLATSNNDKMNHGKGIRNVQKAVDKYNGLFTLNCEGDLFIADVLLYDTIS